MSQEQLQEIADLLTAKTLFCTKEVLTSDETAMYMGVSKSYLYKLTMRGEIPHYKPMGKLCYFNRVEVEQWLQQNRVATSTEIADRANQYCMKGGKR
jgi:excisionase family DNA binding protein